MEDYAKMKYTSGKEFMDGWTLVLAEFTKNEGAFTKVDNKVKK